MKYDFEQSDKAFSAILNHYKRYFYRALGKIFLLWNPALTRSLYDCDGQ